MAIFTPDDRERLRGELVSAAQRDSSLCGAAHTGSGASLKLDRWSDIDLALCLNSDTSHERVVAEWTELLYRQYGAVAHVDVMRGTTLFRVFLLENTLQVDIAFWSVKDFAPTGPNFRLIFGQASQANAQSYAVPPNYQSLTGMAWLYALHVRSSLGRGRILQAECMLSGMRSHVCELMCLRCGVNARQGRGLDDLPSMDRDMATACIPRSLDPCEMQRAFQNTMRALLAELQQVDRNDAIQLSRPLNEIATEFRVTSDAYTEPSGPQT